MTTKRLWTLLVIAATAFPLERQAASTCAVSVAVPDNFGRHKINDGYNEKGGMNITL